MAVYYKFKSARDYDSIPMDGPFISVGVLKDKILESKHLGKGTDFDLLVTNAQTNEEYLEEAMLIPKNTSVLIRRVPGRPRMPIVTEDEPKMENKEEDVQPEKSSLIGADSSAMKYPLEDSEWDEFGSDLYAIPEVLPVQSSVAVPDVVPTNKADEESKIKALINTPALDWQRQGNDGFGPGRGFGRGMAGRMGGRGFGMERKTPPQGYVCHRCNVPGHFIQHCPTNGDPNYDIKRVKPPTGIPKSMLMASSDGSYALPSGAVAILKPNEAAFEKEIEGLPSTRSIGDLPPELHCPLCKEVMKDAVLTSKCCFKSFCDKCIRDHIISKSMCVCGATNILADDLLPNKTLRDTINRIMESGNSSTENVGSAYQVQDMESARCSQPKVPSPSLSAASKGEQKPSPPPIVETQNSKGSADEIKAVAPPPVQSLEKARPAKIPDVSEATHESVSVRETASQGSVPLIEEEVQQRPVSGEAAKKKKKKKVRMPTNAADMPWRGPQDLAAENYMMPLGPTAFNPYWSGMQPGMDGFMAPYGGGMPPYMGYGMGPLDMPFGGVLPPDPFVAQPYMMPPVPPQRDLAFGMGLNPAPPIMSREEFEARKADLRRKRENERRVESKPIPRDRDLSRDLGRDMSNAGDVSSVRSKSKSAIPPPSADPSHQRYRSERPSPDRSTGETHRYRSERSSVERSSLPIEPPPRPSKRKSDHQRDSRDYDEDHPDHDRPKRSETSKRTSSEPSKHPTSSSSAAAAAAAAAAAERKHKASVFSRISFPEEELAKKRKVSSSSAEPSGASSTHHYHKGSSANNGYYDDHKPPSSLKAVSTRRSNGHSMDYESSDDDRHFKRKPSRYEPSPPSRTEWEDEEEADDQAGRHSRRRDDRDRHSKHG